MKKIIPAVFVLILVVIISVGVYNYIKLPDGRTLESREEQLLNITKDTAWNISVEQKIENFIVCGICNNKNDKAGIAIFEEQQNGSYKLISRKIRNSDDVIITGISYKGEKMVRYSLV